MVSMNYKTNLRSIRWLSSSVYALFVDNDGIL